MEAAPRREERDLCLWDPTAPGWEGPHGTHFHSMRDPLEWKPRSLTHVGQARTQGPSTRTRGLLHCSDRQSTAGKCWVFVA